jgi:hypothetical protein
VVSHSTKAASRAVLSRVVDLTSLLTCAARVVVLPLALLLPVLLQVVLPL